MSLFLFVFAAKNLPEERETHSHTAEQPSVPQTPAGNATPLHLSKGFLFSKVKACPSPVLSTGGSQAHFKKRQNIQKSEKKKVKRSGKLRMRGIQQQEALLVLFLSGNQAGILLSSAPAGFR